MAPPNPAEAEESIASDSIEVEVASLASLEDEHGNSKPLELPVKDIGGLKWFDKILGSFIKRILTNLGMSKCVKKSVVKPPNWTSTSTATGRCGTSCGCAKSSSV